MKRAGSTLSLALVLAATFLAVVALAPEPRTLPPAAVMAAGATPLAVALPAGQATPALAPAPTERPSPAPLPTPMPAAACTATATQRPAPTATPPQLSMISRAIFVDQNAQVMHVYENGLEVRALPCSTGLPLPNRATPPWVGLVGRYVGTFFSFNTFADDAWYLSKAGGDILIHGAPYTWVDGEKVYQELDTLGVRPSSHGCIRLRPEDARWLTQWNPRGVPIAISPLTSALSR